MGFRDISHHFGLGMVLHGALGDDHCSNVSFLSTFLIFPGNCLHMLYESRTQFSHDIFLTFACLHILAGLLARSFSFLYSFLLIPDHFFWVFLFSFHFYFYFYIYRARPYSIPLFSLHSILVSQYQYNKNTSSTGLIMMCDLPRALSAPGRWSWGDRFFAPGDITHAPLIQTDEKNQISSVHVH